MYICRYGNIRDSYKDDWDSEDEDLLAEVLSDLNFFSAEKRTSASSKGEVCCIILYIPKLFVFSAVYCLFSILHLFSVFRWLQLK